MLMGIFCCCGTKRPFQPCAYALSLLSLRHHDSVMLVQALSKEKETIILAGRLDEQIFAVLSSPSLNNLNHHRQEVSAREHLESSSVTRCLKSKSVSPDQSFLAAQSNSISRRIKCRKSNGRYSEPHTLASIAIASKPTLGCGWSSFLKQADSGKICSNRNLG